jgi:serine/threonine protein kinase
VLILKKLKGEASEPALDVKFKNEIECLGILRRLQHPNIVELLCSFTYLGEYNLVFPKYPLDLERFLKQEEPFGEFIREQTFCDALQGLASALDSVHNVKLTLEDHEVNLHRIGYHHDLRPSNVLVAHNTFLLADFGLARVKDMQTGSKTNFKETKGDYFAPECQNKDFVNQVVGRPIDIWAFGCMVIDIVTYMKRGAKGFHEAREERSVEVIPGWDNCRFYYNGSLRPAVIDHVRGMTRDDGASGEAAGLLQVAKMMLSIDPRDRIAAHQASKHISYVATKSWFYAATKSFEKYIAAVEVDDSSGPSTLDLWFLSNKLNAWGDVLGLTRNQTRYDGFDDSVNVADGIESNLQSGLKNIESSLQTALEERVWARPGLDLNLNPHFNLQETIRQTVERLVQHLKPKCQKRLETICRCTMLAERNIEGTSRYGDSLGEREPGYQDLAAIAAVKKLQAAFAKLATVEPTYQALLLDESRLRGTHTSHGHEFGYLKMPPGNKEQSEQQEVLIERVPYSSKWKEQSAEEKVVRIGSLAKLLSREQQPIGFRFLRCKGLIMSDSEQAYKVLFELPNRGYGIRRQPKSLLTLLTETTKSWKPDLQQKIRLAQGLVLTVQALHSASWLHKALCSQNVLFFPSSAQKLDDYDLSDLYLVNFRMSRPDGKIWITDGPDTKGVHDYQHPDYIGLFPASIPSRQMLIEFRNRKAVPQELRYLQPWHRASRDRDLETITIVHRAPQWREP